MLSIQRLKSGAALVSVKTKNPSKSAVIETSRNGIIKSIVEKPKKFIWSSVVVVALIIWFVADRVGDVGEDIVGTDIDKSIYYLTDEELSELFSDTKLAKNKCQVTRVADGDTIDVICPFRNEETIRYAYLDTPEVWKKVNGKWQEDNQCFGKEASNINKELVEKIKSQHDQKLIPDDFLKPILSELQEKLIHFSQICDINLAKLNFLKDIKPVDLPYFDTNKNTCYKQKNI